MADLPPNGSTFDPAQQVISVLAPDGVTPIPVTPEIITSMYRDAASLSILYGVQVGACLVMLAVLLAMTPIARFRRWPTIISAFSLILNTIRMLLLAIYFTTPWLDFLTVFIGEFSRIHKCDYDQSIAASALAIPIVMLIMAALGLQAYSTVQLWRTPYKVAAMIMSLVLMLCVAGFTFAQAIISIEQIQDLTRPNQDILWVRKTGLCLMTATICWFCVIFNVRLVAHMWTNRTILPSLKGLQAMDVLVITNGFLMFVPVVFAGLEFLKQPGFESASLTQTSVIIVLPLGTLVAQRLANPAWFGTLPVQSPSNSGGTGGRGSYNVTSGTATTNTPFGGSSGYGLASFFSRRSVRRGSYSPRGSGGTGTMLQIPPTTAAAGVLSSPGSSTTAPARRGSGVHTGIPGIAAISTQVTSPRTDRLKEDKTSFQHRDSYPGILRGGRPGGGTENGLHLLDTEEVDGGVTVSHTVTRHVEEVDPLDPLIPSPTASASPSTTINTKRTASGKTVS
ncbi:fungal pheromone mating factor STE2 GPCR-domain-containing protein [Podospora australis]|uniref:Fungal pheromone mating factor STE2 GPCR-domain-containing protein n=1 Tax=Podospora australis TaxID=1536484 RepID=A0AAN6WV16_9PEZI|nr:fungal pheromone mating factor STE2 GPCR-domain-containing protein [Podospora australis]